MTANELYSVRNLKNKVKLLEQARASLLATAEDLASVVDDMPRSQEVKSRVEKLAIKILEIDAQLDSVREQMIQAEIELAKKIVAEVANPTLQKFAILCYVKCLSYKEIAAEMGYTRRNVYFLRCKFLKLFTSISPCFHPLPRGIVKSRKIRGATD